MLRVVRAATVSAPEAQPAIYLKAFAAIRVDQFDGSRALEGDFVTAGIRINAGGWVEEVAEIRDDGERWDGLQRVLDLRAVGR